MAVYQGITKVAGGNTPMIRLTKSEYDALTTEQKLGNIYMTTDEIESSAVATQSTSGLMSYIDKILADGQRLLYIDGVAGVKRKVYYSGIGFGEDCNTYTEEWRMGGGSPCTNFPLNDGTYFYVNTVHYASVANAKQIAYGLDGTNKDALWSRTKVAGTWGAWICISMNPITYVPTITAESGTITSTTATASYVKIGKLVTLFIKIAITSAGTGVGGLIFTLPYAPIQYDCGHWLAVASAGKSGFILADYVNNKGVIANWDNTTIISTGRTVSGTITYMVA